MDTEPESIFKVRFDVVMPGMQKPSSFTIDVKASSRVEALARAEGEWEKITGQYDVSVKEMSKIQVGS